jgi:hypothetical protein
MYGLGVDIATGFEIQPISHFWGEGLTPGAISNVLHIHVLPVTQGTRKYMISKDFKIFSNFPFLGGEVDPRGHF